MIGGSPAAQPTGSQSAGTQPARPLAERHDVALLDLDGVVYLGRQPIPGVPEALAEARRLGLRCAYVTNNASRTPAQVAGHLRELGVPADDDDVVTSAQAAARLLRTRIPSGGRVLVVGGEGLREAVSAAGFRLVDSADDEPQAVAQGWAAGVCYADLAEAALAIRRGAVWIATNRDLTLPTSRGLQPGNGALVLAVAQAAGRQPEFAGKPDPTLHRESVDRTGARDPLVVGDRLDTDIRGAVAAGCDSLLVLTGVSSLAEALTAEPTERATYICFRLNRLNMSIPKVEIEPHRARCAGWEAVVDRGSATVVLSGTETTAASPAAAARRGDDGWRDEAVLSLAAAAVWRAAGEGFRIRALQVPPELAGWARRTGLPVGDGDPLRLHIR